MDKSTVPVEKSFIALDCKRDVNHTMPWFSQKSKYDPRPANVVKPLINGEQAFGTVHAAIGAAKKSIDIVSWGFDPSMRFKRPDGPRIGELLKQKAKAGVEVRILIWKNALANFGENNIIGDGLFGSGGGSSGAGSGVGSTSAGNAGSGGGGFNNYGSTKSGPGSAGVLAGDPGAKAFNREWFANKTDKLAFRTRDFGRVDRIKIAWRNSKKRGMDAPMQLLAFYLFASHHQKMVLVDYEDPNAATGFVMGHNMLRNYWDTDTHDYYSEGRLDFPPWQDLSSLVFGEVLWSLNENFCTAWEKAQPWIGSDMPIPATRKRLKPDAFAEPAQRHGKTEMAQICRTQPQENDRSILDLYKLALSNARTYVYFENQYFRNTELAMHMREMRRKLKAGGWRSDLYVFVVTNVPDNHGRLTTYDMLNALGKSENMPKIDQKQQDNNPDPQNTRALRRKDLEGLNIHVCTLCATGYEQEAAQAVAGGGSGPMGFPNISIYQPPAKTVYRDIYVHSKLMLVDDVFFTIGSANVNVRSMEVDSELNIAMPSPTVTKEWRQRLWKIHTGHAPGDDMKSEFEIWKKLMAQNVQAQRDGNPLQAPLIEFFDDAATGGRDD